MLGDISKAENIYLACGYTDMRKSIDGLVAIVIQNFQLILRPTAYSCSAVASVTELKRCIGKVMDLFFYIND